MVHSWFAGNTPAACIFILLLLVTLFSGYAQSNESLNARAQDRTQIFAETTTAELILDLPDGTRSAALLLESKITGEINGLIASLTLTQRFQNRSNDWVNGSYQFPLPDKAAIDSLTLKTDGRVIRGVVKEKTQAKREFEAAKASGKKAGLLKQNRPNLFAMSLANISPNGEIVTEVTWVETVKFDRGQFSLHLPTTLTPRFIPGNPLSSDLTIEFHEEEFVAKQDLDISAENGWSQNTDEVPDASKITPPQTRSTENKESHQFSIDLRLNAGVALTNVSSATHALNVIVDRESHRIRFANATEALDRDLILNWTPTASSRPDAAVFTQQADGAHHSLIMLMPPVQNIVQTLPKEIVFVIDSSGSMAGVSMLQAKQGLQTALEFLSPADRFNIIDFDNHAQSLFVNPVSATQKNLGTAIQFVDGLIADGGTHMQAALDLAFSQRTEKDYLKQIVFITDGSVGNESALFSLIHKRLGDARLFTMGIGSAPNQHFMRDAARYGRGTFSFIESVDQAAMRMRDLFAKINRPVMRDVKIEWAENHDIEFFPKRMPDLYLGEPVMVVAKSKEASGEIKISGELAGQQWQRTINATTAPLSKNIDKLWARNKIDQLESQQVMRGEPMNAIRDELVHLGVEHQLMTRYTSFIAVEEKPSRPLEKISKNETVPNLMPKGNTMAVPIPNTATPATLLMLLGFLLTALASGLWRPSLLLSFAGKKYCK